MRRGTHTHTHDEMRTHTQMRRGTHTHTHEERRTHTQMRRGTHTHTHEERHTHTHTHTHEERRIVFNTSCTSWGHYPACVFSITGKRVNLHIPMSVQSVSMEVNDKACV